MSIKISLELKLEEALTVCGSLNVTGPYNLTGSDTIRRCGFVGKGKALLERVCHCRGRL